MSRPAESSEYFSAVQRLRTLISELQEMAEQRLAMQQAPSRLWNLLNAISEALRIVRATSTDSKTGEAARDRELQFDEIADPIIDHLKRQYADETQASAAWANCRRNLRAELDNLDTWTSYLLITVYLMASGLHRVYPVINKQAS